MIHSDTVNGSTAFTDSSDSNHIIQAVGDVQHSTAESYAGSSSIYFDGAGDYLSIPDHDDWQLGSLDFTIHERVNFSNLSGERFLLGRY